MRRDPEGSPYVPVAVSARYRAPRAGIDPDVTKTWLRRTMPIVMAHKWMLIASLVISFLGLALQVQIPALLGEAISRSIVGHSSPLSHFVELMALLAVLREIANYFSRRLLLQSAYAMEYDLRCIVYAHLMSLSSSFYDRVQSGQLISRANSDIRAVQMYLVMAPSIVVQCAVVLLAFGEMLAIDAPLALITMSTMPLTVVLGVAMRKRIFPVSWLIQARLAEVATTVEENVSGVRVVKSFAAEQRELTSLARAADRVRWGYQRDADVRGAWAPTIEHLPRLGLAVILLYGGLLAVHDHSLIGTIATFNAYMLMFQSPFRQLGMVIMMSQRAAASAGRIYEVLDEAPEVADRPDAIELAECRGEVELVDACFAYGEGPRVVDHVDLRLRPGETLALVGRTGSGKSTIARLINRSYDVTGGEVRIDGHDVRDLSLASLRYHVGMVLDEPFLFSVSIRDNIAFGRPDASLEEVVAAADAAGVAELVARLPGGYDTVVGERGYSLSGGQRQRVAIARTLLMNPPILVLDDATSAVDVKTEHEIHVALHRLMAGRTTLVVAHRLSTISLADRVALLEGGRIVAIGTHAELLATEPRYAEVLAQADDLRDARAGAVGPGELAVAPVGEPG